MWIKTSDRLPPEGKWVFARHNRGTWIDSFDQANVNCVVVKLQQGITEEERQEMKAGRRPDPASKYWSESEGWHDVSRSRMYSFGDVHGNNLVPYAWETFGPASFNGQEITHWMVIPPIREG
jgi:hypothetical protein